MTACRTATTFFDRTCIQFIFRIEHIHFAMIGVYMSMTSVTAWIYTVKKVNTTFYTLKDIGRCSDSHEVGRFVLWKIWYNCIKDTIHFLMCFTDCQSANCITVQIHLRNFPCMLNTDIFVYSSLVDTKKKLFFIDGIRQTVETCHFSLAACKPAGSTLNGFLYIISVCHTARALIKCHSYGRTEIGLNLHAFFRSHKNLVSVNM